MAERIKLIVADIDGSIKPFGSRFVDPDIESILGCLMANHVYFTVATGRPLHRTKYLFRKVQPNTYGIFENGGSIYNWNGEKIGMVAGNDVYIKKYKNFKKKILGD